jgi:phosphoadenosine phosphosulfate reductase
MIDETKRAIRLLTDNEPEQGYIGCFSGGKDSIVIKELARMASVKVEWHYRKTTIDPPELLYFIKKHHPGVIWNRPKHGNFFKRMVQLGRVPTRGARWCCGEYKEHYTSKSSDTLIMGIRAEESVERSSRWGEVSKHKRTNATTICPIYQWASDEVWTFIRHHKIPYCSLYDEGFARLGCVGCPLSRRSRFRQFERWPKYEQKWKKAFVQIWENRKGKPQKDGRPWFGERVFDSWQEMWNWWLYDLPTPDPRQLKLFNQKHPLEDIASNMSDEEGVEFMESLLNE